MRSGAEMRQEVISIREKVDRIMGGEADYNWEASAHAYGVAEEEVLVRATEEEIVNYNIYMARITGLV